MVGCGFCQPDEHGGDAVEDGGAVLAHHPDGFVGVEPLLQDEGGAHPEGGVERH